MKISPQRGGRSESDPATAGYYEKNLPCGCLRGLRSSGRAVAVSDKQRGKAVGGIRHGFENRAVVAKPQPT
ncbi:hypothetical protein GCM10011610_61670 [Nocardia rhizosphaerihabitans]|uniref:Uncharacterized protein n=1 Tax=Nocardia rhizosphaerihabitans TaxID=1691570 RepID=A0ABQ2KYB2_9NOCA|nr:hypothetical protein GCM10011610_61670 [Nocardia rhizosphaerihabitans]